MFIQVVESIDLVYSIKQINEIISKILRLQLYIINQESGGKEHENGIILVENKFIENKV